MRKYELNTVLQEISQEGHLQPDDEIIIPQDDLYVITWETNFGEFPNSNEKITIPSRLGAADKSNCLGDDTSPPGETFTDMDLLQLENEDYDPTEKTRSENSNDWIDEQQSSGGSDTIVPEVSDDENVVISVENENPRGGK